MQIVSAVHTIPYNQYRYKILLGGELYLAGPAHSKNEGMKHILTQYDSHTFSFHTMGMKEAFILL